MIRALTILWSRVLPLFRDLGFAVLVLTVPGVILWHMVRSDPVIDQFVSRKIRDALEIEMAWLAIASIALAMLAYYYGKRQLEALSTRSVGWFPKHLTEVSDIIRSAQHSVDILTDASDYGSFFAPALHQAVHQELIRARNRQVRVRMLICGAGEPITGNARFSGHSIEELRRQVTMILGGGVDFDTYLSRYLKYLRRPDESNFREWVEKIKNRRESEETKKTFHRLLTASLRNIKKPLDRSIDACLLECLTWCDPESQLGIQDMNDDSFYALLHLRHLWFEMKLDLDMWIHHLDVNSAGHDAATAVDEQRVTQNRQEALHFWIADDRDAVFTFADSGERRGRGFRTKDPAIVEDVLMSVFAEKLRTLPLEIRSGE
ncbi:MAG: hypothetical protein ACLGRW_02605 [Acidobacteriota bacterium]